jgi:predicted DNA-binding transcriptional regulator YafY
MKLTHAARVLRIREMLDAQSWVTVRELQETFGVSRRTVYNDLHALEDAGVPIYSEPGPAGEARWRLQTAAKRTTLTLTIGQILSLSLAQRVLSFLAGTDLHGELSTVMGRMGQGLSPKYRAYLEQLERKMAVAHFGAKSYANKVDVLNDLLTGLLYDELVEVWYRPPKQRVRRHLVEPYSLLVYAESLYLMCHSRTRGEHRIFAVDRITRSRWLKGQPFTYPADYRPEAFTDGAFGVTGGEPTSVEILFDAQQAPYVKERSWHPSQAFRTTKDGRLRMRLRVSETYELLLWLLGRSEGMEILKPAALRERARQILRQAAARHAKKPSVAR